MSAIYKTPLEHPAPGSTPAPPAPLTPDQAKKYDEVLAAVQSWDTLPKTSDKNAESTPLTTPEKAFLTRESLLRYLRATKWSVPHTLTRLRDTLIWRREYNTDSLSFSYISNENETGKQVIFGYDKEGRPCLYLLPKNQNTQPSPKQVEHLVFMLERVLDLAPPGQETLALLIDFAESSKGSSPSVATGRAVLHILQNHYPERLGRALLTNLPWFITMFLKLISPFIDPITKTKIRYNEPLPSHVPASQLLTISGGDCEFEYDHSVYWPALEKLSMQRRKERMERFEKAGAHIGESEVYLWGGDEASLFAVKGQPEEKKDEVAQVAEGMEKMAVNGGAEAPKEDAPVAAAVETEKAPVAEAKTEEVPEKAAAPESEKVPEVKAENGTAQEPAKVAA